MFNLLSKKYDYYSIEKRPKKAFFSKMLEFFELLDIYLESFKLLLKIIIIKRKLTIVMPKI
ncbi:uncharacterized protein SRT_04540 [Streptococcus troglodytae]|uniref:Uncharacterized protein n=1 Tax=Streptococcus troglodytae TaxID=1111760 RepID=A0A1L7LHL7_9STRE|nr:uncharacterized protein SRT_04540 [Streptococcus troglodytae]